MHPSSTSSCEVTSHNCEPSVAWTGTAAASSSPLSAANYYFKIIASFSGAYSCGNGINLQVLFDNSEQDNVNLNFAAKAYTKTLMGSFTTARFTISAVSGNCQCVRLFVKRVVF